jgi:hypothetical protein
MSEVATFTPTIPALLVSFVYHRPCGLQRIDPDNRRFSGSKTPDMCLGCFGLEERVAVNCTVRLPSKFVGIGDLCGRTVPNPAPFQRRGIYFCPYELPLAASPSTTQAQRPLDQVSNDDIQNEPAQAAPPRGSRFSPQSIAAEIRSFALRTLLVSGDSITFHIVAAVVVHTTRDLWPLRDRFGDLVGPNFETLQSIWAKCGCYRNVGCVAASGDQHSPNSWHVVSWIECVPRAT